jgi:hypothetical protein
MLFLSVPVTKSMASPTNVSKKGKQQIPSLTNKTKDVDLVM